MGPVPVRGLWKVECEGYMAALAHHVLKMVRKLGHGVGPGGPASPASVTAMSSEHAMADAGAYCAARSWRFFWLSWLVTGLTPALR